MTTKFWVVELRFKKECEFWMLCSSLEKVKELLLEDAKTDPDVRKSGDPWWYATYPVILDAISLQDPEGQLLNAEGQLDLYFFDWYGRPIDEQAVNGYELVESYQGDIANYSNRHKELNAC
jgi:hypothetical protein